LNKSWFIINLFFNRVCLPKEKKKIDYILYLSLRKQCVISIYRWTSVIFGKEHLPWVDWWLELLLELLPVALEEDEEEETLSDLRRLPLELGSFCALSLKTVSIASEWSFSIDICASILSFDVLEVSGSIIAISSSSSSSNI
jgi:hypothetical protein